MSVGPPALRNYLERGGTAVPARPQPKSTFEQSEIVSSFQICGSTRVFLPRFSIKPLSFPSSPLSFSIPLAAVSPFFLKVSAVESVFHRAKIFVAVSPPLLSFFF